MKKVLGFLIIVIIIFAFIALLNDYQNKEKLEGNPYRKEKLHQATIDLLDDPNYGNIILPEELEAALANGETKTVYFFSSTCDWCKKTTPIVVPLAESLGIELELYNVLEFQEGWDQYGIEGTPTLIHFENGKEVARTSGYNEDSYFRDWFMKYVLKTDSDGSEES